VVAILKALLKKIEELIFLRSSERKLSLSLMVIAVHVTLLVIDVLQMMRQPHINRLLLTSLYFNKAVLLYFMSQCPENPEIQTALATSITKVTGMSANMEILGV
jgi:hypothetical protein